MNRNTWIIIIVAVIVIIGLIWIFNRNDAAGPDSVWVCVEKLDVEGTTYCRRYERLARLDNHAQ